RVEAEGIRHAQRHEFAVDERVNAVEQICGRHRHVVAEAERIVLIDPRVVARLGARLRPSFEARPGKAIERPAFAAMVAGRLGTVQRALALASVERAEMTAAERDPDDAFAVDVRAARAEARQRNAVDLGERGRGWARPGIETHDCTGKAEA